jgi:hypothetical protein
MFDLSSVSSARKQAETNFKKSAMEYETEFNEGLNLLQQFTVTPEERILKKASGKFFNALKCRRSQIEPYCYLSYIFFLFDHKTLALEYLKYAESINPQYPQVKEIKTLIYTTP